MLHDSVSLNIFTKFISFFQDVLFWCLHGLHFELGIVCSARNWLHLQVLNTSILVKPTHNIDKSMISNMKKHPWHFLQKFQQYFVTY